MPCHKITFKTQTLEEVKGTEKSTYYLGVHW